MNPTEFITLLSTPRLVCILQDSLLSTHPRLQVDGFFGPETGKAMGEAYVSSDLLPEWNEQIPSYQQMYALQLIVSVHHPLTLDGYFGPTTGEKLGRLIQQGQHTPEQKTNDDAIAILKEFEGNGLPGKPFQAYICPTGEPTKGWGHTKTVTHEDVANGVTITEDEAERLLGEDLAVYEKAVRSRLKVSVGSNMFSAMVLLAYNIGAGGFKQSTVLRKTNNRNYREAAAAFRLWDKGIVDGEKVVIPGLQRRREAERELYERDL